MEKESKSGSMAPNMKAPGRMTKPMEKVSSYMLVEIYMKGCGVMIKRMDRVRIITPMAHSISEIGSKIRSTVKELNHGLMVASMKVNMLMIRNKVKAGLLLAMEAFTKENFIIMKYQDMDNIPGPMVNSTKVNGHIIKCLGKVH